MNQQSLKKKNSKSNISTLFLLPALEFTEQVKKQFLDNGFKTTYLYCKGLVYPYPVMFLLFEPNNLNQVYYSFDKTLELSKNYIETFDLGLNSILYVFRIPTKYIKEYELFLQGKYSKFSDGYKKLFPEYSYMYDSSGRIIKDSNGNPKKENSSFYHVFNRTEYIKDRYKERYGYSEDDTIFDDIELYEKQNEEKESIIPKFEL